MPSQQLSALLAALLVIPQATAQARPQPAAATALRQQSLEFGTAWYPEQWPESRWETDLQMMQDAHMNVVRIAEFAWSTMEPSEGRFEFVWLDRAIALAAKHNMKVVLGTPTAAPPAWLTTKYPDTLRVDENGTRAEHGNRQHFSFTSPTYRRFAIRIAEQMAKHYGHNPNILGWQIDNELAAPSFDPSTRTAWHAWLRHHYGTVAELNRKWATAYWSEAYDTFDEVPMHSTHEHPALLLDWKRFVTDTWIDYVGVQVAVIRSNSAPAQWITTNTMHWFQGFDHYKLHVNLDLAAWDDYYQEGHLDVVRNMVQHDLVRGFKQQNFWVMETQPGFVNWGNVNAMLPPGVVREMAWQAVGHGADAVLYWQWRPAPNGQEEYHGSLLGGDGKPVPVLKEVARTGDEFARAADALRGTEVHADIAILQDYDSHWAVTFQPQTIKYDYETEITNLYRAFGMARPIDLIAPTADLSHYRVVFAPGLNVLPDALAQHLLDYVRNGGTLVLGARSGMKDVDNALQTGGQPGSLLIAALGARVAQYYALDKPQPMLPAGAATAWAEQLETLDAGTRVLMTYGKGNGWLDGAPAAVEHSVGKGHLIYLGATLDAAGMQAFLQAAKLPLPEPLLASIPADVEVMERTSPQHHVWIIENHGQEPRHVDLAQPANNLLASQPTAVKSIDLEPHGVAVLEVVK